MEFVFGGGGWAAYFGGAEVARVVLEGVVVGSGEDGGLPHCVYQAELDCVFQVWSVECALCFLSALGGGLVFSFIFCCVGGLDCCADLVEGEEEGGRLSC